VALGLPNAAVSRVDRLVSRSVLHAVTENARGSDARPRSIAVRMDYLVVRLMTDNQWVIGCRSSVVGQLHALGSFQFLAG
jgi:hypothetical protein